MTSCWIVTEDGLRGTENQCVGIANALGLDPVIKRIGLNQPWKSLSPWLRCETAGTFTGDPLSPPWPDLLIASGRKSIAASRYIKKQSGGQTYTVQVQDPRISPKHFDLVAVPAHDPLRGDNVIVTQATPNRVTADKLAQAKETFRDLLAPLPAPRVAVLIGGNSRTHTLTPEIMSRLATDLSALSRDEGVGLMITASRRTGKENEALLKKELADTNALIWDGTGENPYYGFLAWADFIIVTADSASMISEAATTGKPVYMVPMEGGSKRFDTLHNTLIRNGIIREFDGKLESYEYSPLNDSERVAAEIRKRFINQR